MKSPKPGTPMDTATCAAAGAGRKSATATSKPRATSIFFICVPLLRPREHRNCVAVAPVRRRSPRHPGDDLPPEPDEPLQVLVGALRGDPHMECRGAGGTPAGDRRQDLV